MTDAAVAAIQYALRPQTDEALAFLRAWNEGEFDVCRKEWPDAPPQCYIGADPLLPETIRAIEAEQEIRDQAAMWRTLIRVADISPAVDFNRQFWRGVIELPAKDHATFEDAIRAAVISDSERRKVA